MEEIRANRSLHATSNVVHALRRHDNSLDCNLAIRSPLPQRCLNFLACHIQPVRDPLVETFSFMLRPNEHLSVQFG